MHRDDDERCMAGLSSGQQPEGKENGVEWRHGGMAATSELVVVVMVTQPGGCHGGRGGWRRVEAHGYGDRVDRSGGSIFGIGRKSHQKSFPVAGGCGGGRWRGCGGGWPNLGRGEGVVRGVCVCIYEME
ncbi:hypothetical protein Tco_0290305 [Tanacetum coccineum]